MKAYEIFVTRVTEDWGRFDGYERIAIVTTEEKVANKIAAYRAEHEVNQFWMGLATERVDGKLRIKFKVNEVEVE